ncbi:MAG: hypothetical protein ACKO3N_05030, partial [Verrucomicrobiota bacterium]
MSHTSPARKRALPGPFRRHEVALLGSLLLLGGSTVLAADAPPTISLAYTTPGNAPIQGAVSLGNSGTLYLTTLGTATDNPRAIALSSSHTVLWTKDLGAGAKVLAPPSVSPEGSGYTSGRMPTSSSVWIPATASSRSRVTRSPALAT